MNPLLSLRTRRTLTLLLFAAILFCCLILSSKSSSQANFDLRENQPVRVLMAPTPTPAPSPDPLAQFRENRAQYFQETEKALSGLTQQAGQDEAVTAHVLRTLNEQTTLRRITELTESALVGLGYQDAVCAAATDSITVFLRGPLNTEDGQMLTDLICIWSGLPASAVCLIETQ